LTFTAYPNKTAFADMNRLSFQVKRVKTSEA
jgi:hypothetical protein